jgi:hypothetical protein
MEPNMIETAEIAARRAIARRLFDALCAQYPDKYIALIQPPNAANVLPPAPGLAAAETPPARLP